MPVGARACVGHLERARQRARFAAVRSLLMPLRVATGAASVLEIAVAALLVLAATFGMLRLAGAV